jgi:hypothetical protein
MSDNQDTASALQVQSPPVYLTSVPAAEIISVTKDTVIHRVEPDAWYTSVRGDKQWPLWLRSTVERYRDERLRAAQQ